MSKIFKINRCIGCINFVGSDACRYDSHCRISQYADGLLGRPVDNPHFIPSWCPLEDVKW